jgi:hypothetical protein
MAMEQPAAQGAQGGQPQGQGGNPEQVLMETIIQIDQGLTGLTQVIGGISPQAGQALEQLNAQYRQIIEGAMSQAQGGGRQPAAEAAPMETGGARGARPVM